MDNTMKRSATYLLGVLLLLAAGSCSVQKKCKAPQLDMPAEIVAGQSDTLTLSDRKWWEVYTDTTLCRLIGRTLDRNRNMLSAEARIRQLEELYRVSKAARLPSLGGLAAADYETNDYYGEAHKGDAEFDVKATLSWEADLWGNLRWAKRKGAAEYLASVEAARAMQMTLVAEVATAYFELVALDHELGVVRRTVETREESVRQAKLRFEGGLTSETAYQQAKVELASASALIPDLELRIAQKENQISVLAGDYPSRVARSKMDMNVRMPDSLPVGLPSTLLQRRPDVRQAEQNLKAAMASAGMAYADRFPRLTISLTGGLENDALKGLINSPHRAAVRLRIEACEIPRGAGGLRPGAAGLRTESAGGFPRSERRRDGLPQHAQDGRTEIQPQGGGPAIRRAGQIAVYQRRDPLHRRARRPAEVLRRTGRGEQGGAQRAPRARGVVQGPRGRVAAVGCRKKGLTGNGQPFFFPSLARMRLNDCGVIQR